MASMNWINQGTYLYSPDLDKEFQKVAQEITRFRQFATVKKEFGKNSGETFNWPRIGNVSTIGGTLVETNTMHESDPTISWGTGSVNEIGNSIPFTFKMEALSQLDVVNAMKGALLDDAKKVIDGLIERKFNSCVLRYVGSSTTTYALTTNGAATATNTSALNSYHVRKMRLELEKRNVREFDSNGFAMICSIEALESLEGAIEGTYQYTELGIKKVFTGEVGQLHGVRFIKDGYASRYTYDASARTSTAKSWAGGNSLDAYMFGKPTVIEAVSIPEGIRVKVPTDFGRSKGIAWYAILGHQIMWGDSAADQANSRIIKWDSA